MKKDCSYRDFPSNPRSILRGNPGIKQDKATLMTKPHVA